MQTGINLGSAVSLGNTTDSDGVGCVSSHAAVLAVKVDGGLRLQGTSCRDQLIGSQAADVIFGHQGHDFLEGLAGPDILLGGPDNDDLLGGDGPDLLSGGLGDDRLLGGAGDDDLIGGAGNDVLQGGAGDDAMRGDAGADTFVWLYPSSAERSTPEDSIEDFTPGEDRLDLRGFFSAPDPANEAEQAIFLVVDANGDTRLCFSRDYRDSSGSVQSIDQRLTLRNLDMSQGGLLSEQQVLENMLEQGILVV